MAPFKLKYFYVLPVNAPKNYPHKKATPHGLASNTAQKNKKLFRDLKRHKWKPQVREFLPKFHESLVLTHPQTDQFIEKEK